MRDDDRRRGRAPRGSSRREIKFDDVDDRDEDRGRGGSRGRSPKGGGGRARGKRAAKQGFFARLFGRSAPPARGGRIDFGDDDDRDDDYEDSSRTRRPRRRRSSGEEKKDLIDLCMPVFGFASLLPRTPEGVHPSYQQFREQVVGALNAIERDAVQAEIAPEDARQATYALCFFMDEQIAQSEWREKMQWAAEPLGIFMQQDPEGGVNFFRRLEGFGDREKAVKEVYLVCLALGYRGRYAEMEATQQAAEIGDIRKKLVRSISRAPLDRQDELFPEAYRDADALEDDVPPPPRWWLFTSLGAVALAIVLWVVLWFMAGNSPKKVNKETRELISHQLQLDTSDLTPGGSALDAGEVL